MNWWGKLVGSAVGMMLGGPLGALLGGVLGHQFDIGWARMARDDDELEAWAPGAQERVQAAFFTATFAVMGRIAKADGRVSPEEIRVAESVMADMELTPEQRKVAIDLFHQGRDERVNLEEIVNQFREECHRRKNLLQFFMELQITVALADGELHEREQSQLRSLAASLGFSVFAFERMLAMVIAQQRFFRAGSRSDRSGGRTQGSGGQALGEAYRVLGVDSDASDAEVKKAYRRLISQHHPDKLVSKGLPEEMMKVATEKTRQIKAAYETIMAARQAAKNG